MKTKYVVSIIAISSILILLIISLLLYNRKTRDNVINEITESNQVADQDYETTDASATTVSADDWDDIKDKLLEYDHNTDIACDSEDDIIPNMDPNYKSYEQINRYVSDVTGVTNYMFHAIGLDDIEYDVYFSVLSDGVHIEVTSYEE